MARLRNFLALPAAERMATLEAAAALTMASAMLSVLPFHRVANWLGGTDEAAAHIPANPDVLKNVGTAVIRAARHLPWRPLCLPQAMAARVMLRRRGIASTLHFGMNVASDSRQMLAHAWLTVGETGVIGQPDDDDFAVLARFSR